MSLLLPFKDFKYCSGAFIVDYILVNDEWDAILQIIWMIFFFLTTEPQLLFIWVNLQIEISLYNVDEKVAVISCKVNIIISLISLDLHWFVEICLLF